MVLHVLWMICKILLALIGIVLGLLLLALALVLFCPVRYEASASKQKEQPISEATASASVSWLFRGVCVRVALIKKEVQYDIRLFGISLLKLKERRANKKNRKEPKEPDSPAEAPKPVPEAEKPSPAETPAIEESAPKQEAVPKETPNKQPEKKSEKKPTKEPEKKAKAPAKQSDSSKSEKSQDGKLKALKKKWDWWQSFLKDPRVQQAISLVLTEAKRLLRHIFPKKLWGDVTFGFEDPSVTGKLLAVLGITIPFHENRVLVHPLWDEGDTFYGEIHLRGRVYGIVVVLAALKILFSKNIKYLRRRFKHKEANHGRQQSV